MSGPPIVWGDLYGEIIRETGWTMAEVDDLDIPTVQPLLDYWRKKPSVRQLLEELMVGTFGYEFQVADPTRSEDDDFEDMLGMFGVSPA